MKIPYPDSEVGTIVAILFLMVTAVVVVFVRVAYTLRLQSKVIRQMQKTMDAQDDAIRVLHEALTAVDANLSPEQLSGVMLRGLKRQGLLDRD